MMTKHRCEDRTVVHLNLACGTCGNSIGMQAEDYHWHLVGENAKPCFAYHAACVPEVSEGG